MRMARVAMLMDDGGGAPSSVQHPGTMGYGGGHAQPPPFWSTPTSYLFIGFAVVMSLIAVALAVLLCSRRKEEEEGRQEVVSVRVLAPLDREDAAVPRVVVIMAGDHAPSFLASAAPFARFAAGMSKAAPAQQVGAGDKDKDGGAL
jgi:hypothetical protein